MMENCTKYQKKTEQGAIVLLIFYSISHRLLKENSTYKYKEIIFYKISILIQSERQFFRIYQCITNNPKFSSLNINHFNLCIICTSRIGIQLDFENSLISLDHLVVLNSVRVQDGFPHVCLGKITQQAEFVWTLFLPNMISGPLHMVLCMRE